MQETGSPVYQKEYNHNMSQQDFQLLYTTKYELIRSCQHDDSILMGYLFKSSIVSSKHVNYHSIQFNKYN